MYIYYMYSLLHLECHFFILESQSTIYFSRSLLPRSFEKRPRRLRLEIEIQWHSKCKRLYIYRLLTAPQKRGIDPIYMCIYRPIYMYIYIDSWYMYIHRLYIHVYLLYVYIYRLLTAPQKRCIHSIYMYIHGLLIYVYI